VSWRWRRTARFGHLRITATRSGISASVRLGPLTLTHRANGTWQRTVRVPGGLYEVEPVGRKEASK
jgi:hypothetical protein